MKGNPAGIQVGMNRSNHLIIEGRHDMILHFDYRDRYSTPGEVFRHLQTHKAAADDDRAFSVAFDYPIPDITAVRNSAKREYSGEVNTRKRWPNRGGAGGKYQGIVFFPVCSSGLQIPYFNFLFLAVN